MSELTERDDRESKQLTACIQCSLDEPIFGCWDTDNGADALCCDCSYGSMHLRICNITVLTIDDNKLFEHDFSDCGVCNLMFSRRSPSGQSFERGMLQEETAKIQRLACEDF